MEVAWEERRTVTIAVRWAALGIGAGVRAPAVAITTSLKPGRFKQWLGGMDFNGGETASRLSSVPSTLPVRRSMMKKSRSAALMERRAVVARGERRSPNLEG